MTFAALIVASFLACDLTVPPDTSGDSGDTGSLESGSDDGSTDVDAGSATGDDTGNSNDTGEASDTASSQPTDSCTVSDLTFTVKLRNTAGEELAASVPRDESVKVWSVIENQCNNPINYQTPNRCLVSSWNMTNSSGAQIASGEFPCAGPRSTHTVAPESTLEQEIVPLHGLTVGTFSISVTWGGSEEASTTLSVAR